MAGESRITTDHETIKRWTEDRNGKPTSVKGTPRGGEHAGLLRIDFPGYSGEETLEEISWDEFFDKFEESGLAFLYQDKLKSGETSRFFKFIDRNSPEAKEAL
ncbi:MAG: hypothetical protein WAN36_16485 [Calditrichia bacterium]